MIIQIKFKKCSLCLKTVKLTSEHIIPKSIGGTLEAKIQCSACNSLLGTKLVSQIKKNPSIRLAIRNLKINCHILDHTQYYWTNHIA